MCNYCARKELPNPEGVKQRFLKILILVLKTLKGEERVCGHTGKAHTLSLRRRQGGLRVREKGGEINKQLKKLCQKWNDPVRKPLLIGLCGFDLV